MSDFTLIREEIEEIFDYDVLVTEFENESEQRRLRHDKKLMGFKIKSPWRTNTQMQQYRDFFISKYGGLTSFTFTSPFDNVEYNVRFEPGTFKTKFVKGLYQVQFQFKVLSEA